MARFGINVASALGVSVTDLRAIARKLGKDHALARRLWATGVHEARILPAFVDAPEMVTEAQADRWIRAFDSWDLCDQVCTSLFQRTPFAFAKAAEWAGREREFEKRAGFALMAALAVHRKDARDEAFVGLLRLVEEAAGDPRNFVKKSVNWALRQIGKRSARLRRAALAAARRIRRQPTASARWIASDAIRELERPARLLRTAPRNRPLRGAAAARRRERRPR
ncbi:DNA alkylation repair protein [soil metagenome]